MRRSPTPVVILPEAFDAAFVAMPQMIDQNYDPCPRCGKPHENLLLQKFMKPMITEHVDNDRGSIDHISCYFTHWAMCPVLQEPIVFSFKLE